MHEQIKSEHFIDVVQNPDVMAFAQQILTESYVEAAVGYETEMRDLLSEAFTRLAGASQEDGRFEAAVRSLISDGFRKGDPDFWFNRVYRRYKQEIKPAQRYASLRQYLHGERVLDLGCGNGLTSAILAQNSFRPELIDVLDYRDPGAQSLPFTLLKDSKAFLYPDDRFDTAIVFAVLHHVGSEDLLPLLGELRRVSRRAVIEEDCYQPPQDLESPPGISDPEQMQAYRALTEENQLRYLMFVDYFANAITQGLPQMHMPFDFRTVQEWQELFAAEGFRVEQTVLMGFQKGLFNRSCHVWFVLD